MSIDEVLAAEFPPVSVPLLLPVRDFARAEGLGRDTTYRLIAEGRIRVVRVGRKILVPRSELEGFVARESVRADGGAA